MQIIHYCVVIFELKLWEMVSGYNIRDWETVSIFRFKSGFTHCDFDQRNETINLVLCGSLL